ncbi:hypothetical protein PR048_026615 [Dryococelus australis]|uniref:Uncharacterized protein n=1 Tax=Dryococelus australis TaxID=614101 RepID=A0ABQ9GLV3_9NEOP|nr:hypothetical protein PR048_026615 [Dryococelus australis]
MYQTTNTISHHIRKNRISLGFVIYLRQNERARKIEDPLENPPTSGIVSGNKHLTQSRHLLPPFRTMPLVGGISRGSPVSPSLSFRRCSILTSITLIGSQNLNVYQSENRHWKQQVSDDADHIIMFVEVKCEIFIFAFHLLAKLASLSLRSEDHSLKAIAIKLEGLILQLLREELVDLEGALKGRNLLYVAPNVVIGGIWRVVAWMKSTLSPSDDVFVAVRKDTCHVFAKVRETIVDLLDAGEDQSREIEGTA